MATKRTRKRQSGDAGKLRIGDQWNAITIIALSQTNPLKAVAEFVENSIDARAKQITIVRGRKQGAMFLSIRDDGGGVPLNDDGIPDFQYVATHICDSLKRRLKAEGEKGIQGEFGIGLLSFWTVGEQLSMCCRGEDGRTYEMVMRKGDPGYEIQKRRTLISEKGTELTIFPLLPGVRQLNGDRIQRYLASELRDRIRTSGAKVRVVDRVSRAEFTVEPRKFTGRLLHDLPAPQSERGEIYVELYLAEGETGGVGLHRSGTRVLSSITELHEFQHEPWSSGILEGIVDAPFLNVTPGSRLGVLRDQAFVDFRRALVPVEAHLLGLIEERKRAEEERASERILHSVQRAFKEAFLRLPPEDYDWFEVQPQRRQTAAGNGTTTDQLSITPPESASEGESADPESDSEGASPSPAFYEYAGPLHSVVISPRSSVVAVEDTRTLRAVCRDKSRRQVVADLSFEWTVTDGGGTLDRTDAEIVSFAAPAVPGLTQLHLVVRQGDTECDAEAAITVAESLVSEPKSSPSSRKGLPGYTYESAPGQDWRSRFDAERNLVVINNAHRDFVYASKQNSRMMRYICRLFSKEMVMHNFPGYPQEEILERMVELLVYTEENLR